MGYELRPVERWKRASTVYACPRCGHEFETSDECRAHIRGCQKASVSFGCSQRGGTE